MTSGQDPKAQRKRVVITAWVLAVVALAIFTAFILSGVLRA
ncbi:MAG: hypothetical protein P8Y54_03605 [Xanthomonadales bacterium]